MDSQHFASQTPTIQVGDTVRLSNAPANTPDTGTIARVNRHRVLVLFPIRCYRWIEKSSLVWALGNRKYKGAGKWKVAL